MDKQPTKCNLATNEVVHFCPLFGIPLFYNNIPHNPTLACTEPRGGGGGGGKKLRTLCVCGWRYPFHSLVEFLTLSAYVPEGYSTCPVCVCVRACVRVCMFVHCKNSMVTLTNKYGYLSSMFVLSMPGRCKPIQRSCKMCTQSSKKCGGLSDSLNNNPLVH